jgi:hypothetical protein
MDSRVALDIVAKRYISSLDHEPQTLIIQPIFFTKGAISAPSIVYKTDHSFINILIFQLCLEST